ncbi:MAG: sulfotransferase domain-containing protein [Aeromicrobium sp.]
MLDSRIARWARQSAWARPIGILAYRTVDRLSPATPGARVLVNAVPKAGTHLLMGLYDEVPGFRFTGRLVWVTEVDQHDDDCVQAARRIKKNFDRCRPSHYLMGHVMHHPRVSDALASSDVTVVTMVRDPRAIAASAVRYFEESKLRQRDLGENRFDSREELAQWLIDGDGPFGARRSIPPLAERCRQYLGWLDDPTCLVVRFEDLIGEQGGSSREAQVREIERILRFSEVPADVTAEQVAARIYSGSSHTFSVGKVRSWESVLTPGQIAQIEDAAADVLERLGYEH